MRNQKPFSEIDDFAIFCHLNINSVTPSIYSLFVLGAVLTCILTPLIRYFALQKGFVDCPQRARKVHEQATPRLGGAAILTSYLGVLLVGGVFIPQLREMLWGENLLEDTYYWCSCDFCDWYFG